MKNIIEWKDYSEQKIFEDLEQYNGDIWKVWDVTQNRKNVAVMGWELPDGSIAIKIHSSLNISHDKVLHYLKEWNLYYKWIIGWESSKEIFQISPEGSIAQLKMKSRLFKFLPKEYTLNIFVSNKKGNEDEYTYFKTINVDGSNAKSKPIDLFMIIQTVSFREEQITYIDAKILVKPQKGYFKDYLAKQLALDLGISISNLESFIIEKTFMKDSHIVDKSKSILHQIELIRKEFVETNNLHDFKIKFESNKNFSNNQTETIKPKVENSKSNEESETKSKHKKIEEIIEEQIIEIDDESIPEVTPHLNSNMPKRVNSRIESVKDLKIEEEKALSAKPTIKEEKEDESWRELWYQDGIWHKWIVERCTEEQKEMYKRVKQKLEQNGMFFSENAILKFLASKDFNEEIGYENLVKNHSFYKDNNVEVLIESEFQK